MKLIVGLGNPGKEYAGTRHNVGFNVVESLISNAKFLMSNKMSKFKLDKMFNSEIAEREINGEKIILIEPHTFMNNSGLAVKKNVTRYKLHVTRDIIVIHDDITLELGQVKISQGAGAGNHNGVQSIIDHLVTKDFIRIRCGIGRGEGVLHDVVLSKFRPEEKSVVQHMINRAVMACVAIVTDGVEKAMNRYN